MVVTLRIMLSNADFARCNLYQATLNFSYTLSARISRLEQDEFGQFCWHDNVKIFATQSN